MTDDRYYVKIVPHRGDTIHRFVVRKRHVAALGILLLVAIVAASAFALVQLGRAREEGADIARIAGQTQDLHRQLQRVQRENQEITQLIGVPGRHASATPAPPAPPKSVSKSVSWTQPPATLSAVESQVALLADASSALANATDRERNLALRVLNLRHVRALERAKILAFIPSIDPVEGAQIVGCFCYRTFPSVEFHEGVDLGASYGDRVRAAAAGTVAAAGWDGGYGMKVDIDHGNGYHTWYAHLSRIDVRVGQSVYKGETIAAVGATGFATGPHLHYQLMLDGHPIDPTPYLNGVPHSVIASLP